MEAEETLERISNSYDSFADRADARLRSLDEISTHLGHEVVCVATKYVAHQLSRNEEGNANNSIGQPHRDRTFKIDISFIRSMVTRRMKFPLLVLCGPRIVIEDIENSLELYTPSNVSLDDEMNYNSRYLAFNHEETSGRLIFTRQRGESPVFSVVFKIQDRKPWAVIDFPSTGPSSVIYKLKREKPPDSNYTRVSDVATIITISSCRRNRAYLGEMSYSFTYIDKCICNYLHPSHPDTVTGKQVYGFGNFALSSKFQGSQNEDSSKATEANARSGDSRRVNSAQSTEMEKI
ncbi:hypothetical protein K435DRAFT_921130 [Dendrothele bispora CBS 962.96]|uniref:Uncharacterized protein n=1 Tax=Dendrothele bispora (strain CBS 962.96) TaxID=1314807 RepID=A0A4S8LE93_DENBC|nr:hypothetical protein K435DRAFT_921130 [Dendrothele bispora CBS 962.96]